MRLPATSWALLTVIRMIPIRLNWTNMHTSRNFYADGCFFADVALFPVSSCSCFISWLVWRSDNGVGHINEVNLRRTWLVLVLVTHLWPFGGSTIPLFYRPLSLAIPPWAGAMSTGDGFGHCWGRNGEFCVATGPGLLAYRLVVCLLNRV